MPQAIARLHPGKPLETALLDELGNLLGLKPHDQSNRDIIHVLRCFTVQNALPIPNKDQVYQASQTASLLVEYAPNATLTGSLLGYGVASINDQLIQALKISEEFA